MSRKTLKLTLAVGLVTFGLGGFAAGLAWATPPQGLTSTNIVGPVTFGAFATKAETDDWAIKMKSEGVSDVYVTHLKIVPGGHGGWHSHPGPSIISVKAGTATFYDDCDGFIRHQYAAGTGFVEDANCVHLLANEGDVDLEVIVVQIVPFEAPRRFDEADPRD
jgi:quercetin dioxygenase-like cupin family protein